jgi:hypothetical protein
MAGRANGYVALTNFFLKKLFGSFNGLLYAREKKRNREQETPLRVRKKEKK